MKTHCLIIAVILATIAAKAQSEIKIFPGTGFGISLPDTGYIETENGFMNRKLHAGFSLVNKKIDLSNVTFGEFRRMMLLDIITKGVTILSDEIVSPDSSSIIKVVIDYDIADTRPATKGRKDVTWLYFYNYGGKPVLLMANYPLASDALLGESFLRSVKSLKKIDSADSRQLFKNNFSITKDYAPLKYCGPALGGILLNMQGKYRFAGGDSSYCLIVPITIALPKSKPDSLRTYMYNRLQIHVNDDVKIQSWKISNSGKFILYEISGTSGTNRQLYLAIKSDNHGYFEIWGQSFKQNKQLIEIFKRIAESLQRN